VETLTVCQCLYVSNEFPCFLVNTELANSEYIRCYFSIPSIWDEVLALSSGGTPTSRNRLKEEQLLRMEIPLPPIAVQNRVVARLGELTDKIEQASVLRQQVKEELEALWESGLQETFNRLTASIPTAKVGKVCEVVRGGSPRPAGSPIFYDGNIPFLKVADLTKDDEKYVTTHTATIKEAGLSRTRYVEAYTLMLTNSGATLGVPKICIFPTTFNDGIQAFLNLPNSISKEYLYYFFRSKTRWFRDWAARGQGQPNLNTEMVKQMEFPLSSLHDQQQVVAYLDELKTRIEHAKRAQAETSTQLDALTPSVLDKAFRGEL
jgi:type I restriction enzyme, S subunit